MVGRIQASHTGSVSTLTTNTAVTVAMVPASILVRCRAIRCLPDARRPVWKRASTALSATAMLPNTTIVTHWELPDKRRTAP